METPPDYGQAVSVTMFIFTVFSYQWLLSICRLQGYYAHKRVKWISILVSSERLETAASSPCPRLLGSRSPPCTFHPEARFGLTSCALQAGKLAPLAGPQPPFHHTSLDAKSELLCSKDYWRRDPDRVFEDSEDEDEDGPFVRCT